MEFSEPKGIYQQIADQIRDQILLDQLKGGERIPSIRELAVELGVNPNTVTKSYQALVEQNVIENQRGLGYFVNTDAKDKILDDRKTEFLSEQLPRLFRTMRLLNVGMDELTEYFESNTGEKS